MKIQHPSKILIPLAAGLNWGVGNLCQQKMDGKFAVREDAGGILAGELMPDGKFITTFPEEVDSAALIQAVRSHLQGS